MAKFGVINKGNLHAGKDYKDRTMPSVVGVVPLVDFQAYGLETQKEDADEGQLQKLAGEIYEAFHNIGFVYLKNHGIPQDKVDKVFNLSAKFCTQDKSVKKRYTRGQGLANHGWVEPERERVNPERAGDLKESFDIRPDIAKEWPDEVVPDFKDTMSEFYSLFRRLADRVLEIMAIGLKFKNRNFFTEKHNPERATCTAMRCLYYPAIERPEQVKENQLRCGEHTDYGSLTLLFQDSAGGLQVYNRKDGYVDAPPIEGTVIVNLGDMMQRWTADQFVSTQHRVMNQVAYTADDQTTSAQVGAKCRQSVVCFIHPDVDCVIECIDSSNKYPPITAKDYLDQRYAETFDF